MQQVTTMTWMYLGQLPKDCTTETVIVFVAASRATMLTFKRLRRRVWASMPSMPILEPATK